jgi:hypothetical protein
VARSTKERPKNNFLKLKTKNAVKFAVGPTV